MCKISSEIAILQNILPKNLSGGGVKDQDQMRRLIHKLGNLGDFVDIYVAIGHLSINVTQVEIELNLVERKSKSQPSHGTQEINI